MRIDGLSAVYLSAKITISVVLNAELIFFNLIFLNYFSFANTSLMRLMASRMLSSLVA